MRTSKIGAARRSTPGRIPVKFTWFNLMPWPHLPDDFRQTHRSVWVDIDSNLYDPAERNRVRHDPAPEQHRGRAGPAPLARGDRGDRQLDRALQPADPGRGRVRDARR